MTNRFWYGHWIKLDGQALEWRLRCPAWFRKSRFTKALGFRMEFRATQPAAGEDEELAYHAAVHNLHEEAADRW